jgi:SAM-dependent methyltransferase
MKVHQNVVIDGVDYGESMARKKSKFYNENRWKNFIEPYLPEDCSDMTFMELGCNAGLFLKMAKEKGFKKVYGIESDDYACEVSRQIVGDSVRNETIDESFNMDTLPCVDYVLMSNFHYHLHLPVLVKLVHVIQRKARYVILVSSDNRTTRHKINTDEKATRHCFRHFKEIKHIPRLPIEGDTKPRRMFSFLFGTELKRIPIEYLIENIGRTGKMHYDMVVRSGREAELRDPILVYENGRIIDGTHRMVTMQREGFKHILAEVI